MTHVFDNNTCNPGTWHCHHVAIKSRFNALYCTHLNHRIYAFIKSDRVDFWTYFTAAELSKLEDVYWPPNGSSVCDKKQNLGQHIGVRWLTSTLTCSSYTWHYRRFLYQTFILLKSKKPISNHLNLLWQWMQWKLNPKCKALTSGC